jgi:hypothetical protein
MAWLELWSEPFDDNPPGPSPEWTGDNEYVEVQDEGTFLTVPVGDVEVLGTEYVRTFPARPGRLLRLSGRSKYAGQPGRLDPVLTFWSAPGAFLAQSSVLSAGTSSAEWVEWSGTVAVPPNATLVGVKLNVYNLGRPTTTYGLWDSLTLEEWVGDSIASGETTNLVYNGGFRSRDGILRQPAGWTYSAGGATMTIARVCAATEQAYILADGDYMAADEALGGSTLILEGSNGTAAPIWPQYGQDILVSPGREYHISALAAGADGSSLAMRVDPLGPDRATNTGDPTYYSTGLLSGVPGGPDFEGWMPIGGQYVTPPGTHFLRVVLFAQVEPGQTFRALWDEVAIRVGGPREWTIEDDAYRRSRPYPAIYFGGMRGYETIAKSAQWSLGRPSWFVGPEVGTAALELEGDRTEVVPGSTVNIAKDPDGNLWVGVVDDVTVSERASTNGVEVTTHVTASDYTSWLSGAKLAGVAFGEEAFDARVRTLYSKAGATVSTKVMPSVGALVQCGAGTVGSATSYGTVLEELDRLERVTNTITQMGPDGIVRVLVRDALPTDMAGVQTPVDLVGDDCPRDLAYDRTAVAKVINLWRFTDGDEPYTTPIPEGGTSAARYGVREYETKQAKATGTRYPAAMRAVLARAIPTAKVTIPVLRRGQAILTVGPFDLVKTRDLTVQALQLVHSVSPGRWDLSLELDATQTQIVGGTAPPPPAPVRKRATVTVTANEDGYAVRTNSGSNSGNGGSGNFLVGLLADGHLCRGFVGFARQTFLGRNRKVVSCTLTLTTNRGGCMQWGSSPKVKIQRVTASWSEGSHATACSFVTGNSLKYPGPTRTSSGEVVATIPAADSRAVNIRIDAIAQAWLDGSAQEGLGILGYTETSANYRAAFDAAGSGRAKYVLVYEYDE